jgi:hypothetical protein
MEEARGEAMTDDIDLDAWLSLRELSMEDVRERFAIADEQVDPDLTFGELSGVVRLHNPRTHPGHFYFKDGAFLQLYVGGGGGELDGISAEALRQRMGGTGTPLRSRVGKPYTHYVYPEQGLAFSTRNGAVRYLQIFPPTSLAAFTSQLYQEPEPYVI